MMKYVFRIAIGCALFLSISCKKDKKTEPATNPGTPFTGIQLNLSYKVDSDPFMTDHFMYTTDAGNNYNITKLVYYLSQLKLVKADSSSLLLKDYQYVDAVVSGTNQLTLKNIPAGNYIGITFNIGLDSLHNVSDTLPATTENINMAWPAMMGGGYHFMKLEGYFKDASGTSFGYAMHLGTNVCLIPIKLYKSIIISENVATPVNLVMNINEWFRHPHTYDFNVDGNYIMGDAVAMKKIAENGVDVFSF